MRLKPIAQKLLLLLATILIALIIGEVAVRLVTPQRLVRGYFAADPELGNVVLPNREFVDRESASSYHVSTNRDGFRMRDEVDLSPERRRILVVGDSYVFGWGVDAEDSFFTLVDRNAREALPSVQLLNAGVGAYSTGHAYKTLARRAEDLDLSAAIYFMNSNDLADNLVSGIDYRVTSYRRLIDGTIELRDEHVYSPLKRFLFARTPYGWLNRHSHLFILIKRAVGGAGRDDQTRAFGLDTESLGDRELAIDVMLAHVDRLQGLAAARELPLLIVWIPAWTELFQSENDANEVFGELKEALGHANRPEFFDPVPGMREAVDAARVELLDVFLPDGQPVGHFSERGNELYAEAVEERVIRFLRGISTENDGTEAEAP